MDEKSGMKVYILNTNTGPELGQKPII